MEHAVIHSDLERELIQPRELVEQYFNLLRQDIAEFLPVNTMTEVYCPVTGEKARRKSFEKFGMTYHISLSLENIYISPRPCWSQLRTFYQESKARRYFLTELWHRTRSQRQEKIIVPQLKWAQNRMTQFLSVHKFKVGEYLPNGWGYCSSASEVIPQVTYQLVTPLIAPDLIEQETLQENCVELAAPESLDAVFLFEALERAPDPTQLLQDVAQALTAGGLCFITCLLSSGFESRVLGSNSDIFTPPERMNLLSFEGMNDLINRVTQFDTLEFSTPGVLDIPNVTEKLTKSEDKTFFDYIFRRRNDPELVRSFQDFLQRNRLSTFGRLVLRKK